MEWTYLDGYNTGINLEDRPRKLIEAEIQYIVDHFPTPPSADAKASEIIREGIVLWIVSALRETELCPSAIPELIKEIIYQHTKSLITPGTPVGITAAEAVGAQTTQMALNTFHTSGSAKSAGAGIEAMRDIIFARKTPHNESCTIYFTNKAMTFADVLNSRSYIVGSMVSDFIKNYDIDTPENLGSRWWHGVAPLLLGKEIPQSTLVMRLFLNIEEMFKHRVSIAKLAEVLEREVPSSVLCLYGPIEDGIIDLYPKPELITATLRDRIGSERPAVPANLAELTYLETIVQAEFKTIRVKGIAGIKRLYPLVFPVWSIVAHQRKTVPEDALGLQPTPGMWTLFYDASIMKMRGLTPENLAALCSNAGLTIIGGAPDRLIVELPLDRFRTPSNEVIQIINDKNYVWVPEPTFLVSVFYKPYYGDESRPDIITTEDKKYERIRSPLVIGDRVYEEVTPNVKITELNPGDYVNYKVKEEKTRIHEETKRQTEDRLTRTKNLPEAQKRLILNKPIYIAPTPLIESSEFVIAETEGANLKDLLALPGIDKERTTCNNMYTIANTLGIEATRNFLVRALIDVISNNGSYVHPANLMFIAEFITSRGEPYGATYTGIARQPGGHLSLATLERAGTVLTQSALHGRKEDIRNVSASVAVGARMALGSGSFDIGQDIIQNGITKTLLNDDIMTGFVNDDSYIAPMIQRKRDQQEKAEIGDLSATIDDMSAFASMGNMFDRTGGDEETDLLSLYGQGEMILDTNTYIPEIPKTRPEIIRRVAPVSNVPPASAELAGELVDVRDQIAYGIPKPPFSDSIRDLQPSAPPVIQTPIRSTGLDRILPAIVPMARPIPSMPVSDELEALLNESPNTINRPMPSISIPKISVSNINKINAQMDLQQEQLRDLELP
jgi:hypothetical protein